jgi:hypothetical protein
MVLRDYRVQRNGVILPIEFCSRKCYLAFWAETPGFEPLETAPKIFIKSACA